MYGSSNQVPNLEGEVSKNGNIENVKSNVLRRVHTTVLTTSIHKKVFFYCRNYVLWQTGGHAQISEFNSCQEGEQVCGAKIHRYVQSYLWSQKVVESAGVVAEWCKVLIAVSWPLMVWSTLALDIYQLRFVSWVFHVILSIHLTLNPIYDKYELLRLDTIKM